MATRSKESKVIFEVQARLNCQTNKLKEQKRRGGTNEDLTEEVNLYRPQGQELEIVLSPKAEVRSNTS